MAGGQAVTTAMFIKTFWRVHRRIVRAAGAARGCGLSRQGKRGALRLTT